MERACDHCARIKYKCSRVDLSHPCDRCSRLSLQCTSHRLPSRRGRPPKRRLTVSSTPEPVNTLATPTGGDDTVSYVSPAASSLAGGFLLAEGVSNRAEHADGHSAPLQLPQLPTTGIGALYDLNEQLEELLLDQHTATLLLEELWLRKEDVFPLLPLQSANPDVAIFFDMEFCSAALTFAMLTCAVLISGRPDVAERRCILAENCRIYALSHIPILTWKLDRMKAGDSYALAILSSLGYLEPDTCDISARWARLSAVIVEDSDYNEYEEDHYQNDVER